ncbi:MAG: A/G-specific adenine glycosylase [Microbacterium sp.]|nr:A/G-specific adenine glycosylase [Microbacterium sp.]
MPPHTPSTPVVATSLSEWYRGSARDLPWRRSSFHNEFGAWGTLVSEFMLQQTPVNRVIPHLEAWLERWPTPPALASATPAEVVHQWANLGYPRRALWLHRAAIEITERHGGVVPRDVDALLALSGIGDYTARAVAVFAYGDRHPVVDTNTRRVLARAVQGLAQPAPPSRRDLALMDSLLPASDAESAVVNAAAMELGATVCTSRAPRCERCPLLDDCAWVAAGRPDTGDTRRRQASFEGSDRQARGAVLRTLREAAPGAVLLSGVLIDWPDPQQRDRAIDSLIADGLAEADGEMLSLPG